MNNQIKKKKKNNNNKKTKIIIITSRSNVWYDCFRKNMIIIIMVFIANSLFMFNFIILSSNDQTTITNNDINHPINNFSTISRDNNSANDNTTTSSSSSLSWINRYRERPSYKKTCYFEYDAVPIGLGSTYDVSIFYHVGMLKNWRSIMLDQLHTLELCGLGYIASDITISFSNPSFNETEADTIQILTDILNKFNFIKHMTNQSSTTIDQHHQQQINLKFINASNAHPYEKPIIENISAVCRQMVTSSTSSSQPNNTLLEDNINRIKTKIVFYFHNKGCSKFVEESSSYSKTNVIDIETYDKIFHWRKYMEWFIIEKPTLCLRAHILHNAVTCGVNLKQLALLHYAGNFWTTSCQYVKNVLPSNVYVFPKKEKILNYISAETWIGNYTQYTGDQYHYLYSTNKYINLFSIPYSLYYEKATLNKYDIIIRRKSFLNLNHKSTNRDFQKLYPSGNQTDLWIGYLNGIQNLTIQ